MKIDFIIIVLLFFFGCRHEQKSEFLNSMISIDSVNINIKDSLLNIVDSLLLSDVVEDIDIVQLEMEGEHLFKKLNNIQVEDSNIFIDRDRGVIFNYDRNGIFKNEVGSIGQGPGEFVYSLGIGWDDNRQTLKVLTGYDGEMYQIMSYSKDNKFISSNKLKLPWGGAFVWYDSHKDFDLILRSLLLVEQTEEEFSVIAVCKSGDKNIKLLCNPAIYGHEEEYLKHKVNWNDLSLSYWIENYPQIVLYDEIASVRFPWNDTIYQFNPSMDDLSVRFILHCGERPDFASIHEAMKKDYTFFKYIQVDEMLESKYHIVWKILNGDECYLLQMNKKNGAISVIKSKTIIETVRVNSVVSTLVRRDKCGSDFGFTNDLCGGTFFYPDYIEDDYWIDRVEVDDLLKIDVDKLKNAEVIFPNKRDKFVKILEKLKEDDNPLLIIARLKK